jgi:hypothetical protein
MEADFPTLMANLCRSRVFQNSVDDFCLCARAETVNQFFVNWLKYTLAAGTLLESLGVEFTVLMKIQLMLKMASNLSYDRATSFV